MFSVIRFPGKWGCSFAVIEEKWQNEMEKLNSYITPTEYRYRNMPYPLILMSITHELYLQINKQA